MVGVLVVGVVVALHGDRRDRAHEVVDDGELEQGGEDEERAGAHPNVHGLHVRHRRQGRLGLRALSCCSK